MTIIRNITRSSVIVIRIHIKTKRNFSTFAIHYLAVALPLIYQHYRVGFLSRDCDHTEQHWSTTNYDIFTSTFVSIQSWIENLVVKMPMNYSNFYFRLQSYHLYNLSIKNQLFSDEQHHFYLIAIIITRYYVFEKLKLKYFYRVFYSYFLLV